MIRFSVLDWESKDKLLREITAASSADVDEVEEILLSFLEGRDEDTEFAVCACGGCLLVRVFDMGRYSFVYPIALSDCADEAEAVEAIRKYVVREELSLVFTDVPLESVGDLVTKFNHVNADVEPGGESYRLEAKSECALLEREPEIFRDDISLSPLDDEDVPLMARLARDGRVNEFWGYDYLSDIGEVRDGYFLENAKSEFNRGCVLTLAIRRGGSYVGEALYYAFDLSGSAEFGLRLLPEYWGMGIGSLALDAIIGLASEIGLTSLTATVDERNERSIRLIGSRLDEIRRESGRVYYSLDI